MTQQVGIVGNAPVVKIGAAPSRDEREVYRRMWEHPEYRAVSPGEDVAQVFLGLAKPKQGATVLDMGCGTGRGSLALAAFGGMNVTMLDFADNCLDADIRPMLQTQAHAMRFVEADLTKPLPASAEYGYCTDVLEHIPPAQIDAVLDNCLHAAQHVFFQISTVDDVCGALIGQPLHLSVHPFEWWLARFNERGCAIHWSHNDPGGQFCCFYVSGWSTGRDIVDAGILNVGEDLVREHVRFNCARGFAQAIPHEPSDREVMIVGGGPSLAAEVETIRALRAEGAALITLNGALDWCLDAGIVPSATIMVDARDFNARFTRQAHPDVRYLLASQCHPSVFDGLKPEQVVLWHTTAEMVRDVLNEVYKGDVWYGIPGGSTVLLRAIPLMRMLGYRKFHLFGCDSCLDTDGKHHAYAQPENDHPMVLPVTVGGRVFHCHPWMASQAQEFMDLIKVFGDEIELQVHGDGLLAHILQAGADAADALDVRDGQITETLTTTPE